MSATLQKATYRIPIKYHFIFWIGYFLFNFIRWGSYFGDYWYSLKSNLVEFSLHLIIVYFNIYYLVPKFILRKKYVKFFIYFILSLAIIYVLRTSLNYVLVSKNIWPEAEGIQKAFTFNHVVAVVLGEIYVITLVSAIKFGIDWVVEKRKNDTLKELQLVTELNFLKTQIQPHFFFNTLNNLYALSIEKSEKTPEVILKLSELMQYILYDAKEPRISLLKEINYIQNYLELEELRFGDSVTYDLAISGDIDTIEVPPLLFLTFIENCFKHGTKGNNTMAIQMSFENKDGYLIFNVRNNFKEENYLIHHKKHGIGIENARRRLELLYQEKFQLKTDIFDGHYFVKLKIPI